MSSGLVKVCAGAAVVAIVRMASHTAVAAPPVHEVQIVASRFAFEPSTIQVVTGESVRLVVRSKDGTHGLAIPALKVDLHVPANGEPVTAEFTAPAAGEYDIACSEFCGRGHGRMKAALVSLSPTRTGH